MSYTVPEYLKDRQCVPVNSRFGKFLKSEALKHAKSRIQEEIEHGVNFPQMSKYAFLKNYVLNEGYSLNDYLSIKDASLRGFLFETLWDICFKCNVISSFDGTNIKHMKGKIEDLRIMYDQVKQEWKAKKTLLHDEDEIQTLKIEHAARLKEIESLMRSKNTDSKDGVDFYSLGRYMKSRRDSLKEIDDLYEYLLTSKVQSGSTAGISDITMRWFDPTTKTHGNWILVSSKFYVNEKAIYQYDIADIVQSVKGFAKKCNVVLVVNDKYSLERNIERSHKPHVRESIHIILDKSDLEIGMTNLRRTLSSIGRSYTSSDDVFKKKFQKFYAKEWKPLIQPKFDQLLLARLIERKLIRASQIVVSCFDINTFFISILALAFKLNRHKYIVHTPHHGLFKHLLNKYYKLNEIEFKVVDAKNTVVKIDVKDKAYNIHWVDFVGQADIQWDLNVVLLTRNLHLQKNQEQLRSKFKNYPSLIPDVVGELYGLDSLEDGMVSQNIFKNIAKEMQRYPNVHVYSNDARNFRSSTFANSDYQRFFGSTFKVTADENDTRMLVDVLVGTPDNYHEDYVFRNIYESNPENKVTPKNSVWILPDGARFMQSFKKAIAANSYITKNYSVLTEPRSVPSSMAKPVITLISKNSLMTSPTFLNVSDVLIVLDNTLTVADILPMIFGMVKEGKQSDIHVVDFNNERVKQIKECLY